MGDLRAMRFGVVRQNANRPFSISFPGLNLQRKEKEEGEKSHVVQFRSLCEMGKSCRLHRKTNIFAACVTNFTDLAPAEGQGIRDGSETGSVVSQGERQRDDPEINKRAYSSNSRV